MSSEKSKESKPEVKTDGRKADSFDVLIANSIFPDPAAVFTARAISLEEAKKTACVVLDTNALLVPYGIGAQTLSQIEQTYRQLLAEQRLFVPAQVAREFARNRVTKLAELHQKLSKRRSQLQSFRQGNYPLLERLPEYKRLLDVEEKLDSLTSEYRKLIASVVDHVRSWEWNDPVSVLYGDVFSAQVVVGTSKSEEEIKREHLRRFLHKIPPGYKDESKDDGGVGDLLIWLAILEIGAVHKTSMIFVSGEEKADWWHRSENQPLYPRYELVDEYRRASGGKSFHIIKFSQLLELFGASKEVVAEVREEESASSDVVPLTAHAAMRMKGVQAERAVAKWFMEQRYTVSPAPAHDRYDYVVDGAAGKFAIDIIYASSESPIVHRLRERNLFFRRRAGEELRAEDLQPAVVVVCETSEVVLQAERAWAKLDPAFRLCTGVLDSEGRFQVSKSL